MCADIESSSNLYGAAAGQRCHKVGTPACFHVPGHSLSATLTDLYYCRQFWRKFDDPRFTGELQVEVVLVKGSRVREGESTLT